MLNVKPFSISSSRVFVLCVQERQPYGRRPVRFWIMAMAFFIT